jgi:cell division protein FtsB
LHLVSLGLNKKAFPDLPIITKKWGVKKMKLLDWIILLLILIEGYLSISLSILILRVGLK